MGAGWYVQGKVTGPHSVPHGGRALLFAQYHLEEFAAELGVEPLKAFFSSNPAAVAKYFREQGMNPDEYELPTENWYDPADAMPTFRALLNRLKDDPGPVQSLDKVRADLQAIADVVAEFDQTGEQFHIATAMPDLSSKEPERHV